MDFLQLIKLDKEGGTKAIELKSRIAMTVPYDWIIKNKNIGIICRNNEKPVPILLIQGLKKLYKMEEKEQKIKDLKSGKIPLLIQKGKQDVHLTCNQMAFTCHAISKYTPLQYVLSFDAPLVIHNYLPYYLELDYVQPDNEKNILGLVNSQEAFETFALDGEDFKNSKMMWKVHIEEDRYYGCDNWIPELKSNQASEHTLNFKIYGEEESKNEYLSKLDLKASVRVNCNLINKYGNFELRTKVFENCTSKKIILFPRYAVVNKTDVKIFFGLKGKFDYSLKEHTSGLFDLGDSTKLSFSAKHFGNYINSSQIGQNLSR